MGSLHRQRGLTAISTVLLLIPVVSFIYIVAESAPVYFEAYQVQQALATLKDQPEMVDASPYRIRERLGKIMNVDYISNPNPRDARISGRPGDLTVALDYQVRKHLLANMDLVFSFHPTIHLQRGGS